MWPNQFGVLSENSPLSLFEKRLVVVFMIGVSKGTES